jgi:hypothetical protein
MNYQENKASKEIFHKIIYRNHLSVSLFTASRETLDLKKKKEKKKKKEGNIIN